MQGRKPKPTALKLLEGNPGKRAINRAEPKPRVVLPKPPEHLSDEEKNKWKLTVRELHPLGLVTTIDKDALAMYCVIFMRWVKAEKMVRDKGEIIKTAAGNIIQNPYLSIANRALEQLNKLGAEFGMTPSSRSRVKVDAADPERELEWMLFGGRAVKLGWSHVAVLFVIKSAQHFSVSGARLKMYYANLPFLSLPLRLRHALAFCEFFIAQLLQIMALPFVCIPHCWQIGSK